MIVVTIGRELLLKINKEINGVNGVIKKLEEQLKEKMSVSWYGRGPEERKIYRNIEE